MERKSFVLGAAVGVLVVVCFMVFLGQNSRESQAQGIAAASGNYVAITAPYGQRQSVLYLLDTKNETLLVYAFHPTTPSMADSSPIVSGELSLLAGRLMRWDTLAISKKLRYHARKGEAKDKVQPDPAVMEKEYKGALDEK